MKYTMILSLVLIFACSSPVPTESPAVFETGKVPYERIVEANQDSLNWLTYSGNYQSHRYAPFAAINRQNVSTLKVAWVYQTSPGLLEVTPIVVDGLMYITEPPSTVTALDVGTGRKVWTWSPEMPSNVKTLGFPPANRGVAILNQTVYVGTLDAQLFALDAKSGAVRWSTRVADNRTGHAITTAPIVVKDKVIIGISGGEAGIRGFLDAYDSETGEQAWRFWTIPGEGEPGVGTWEGDSWKTGAGATWVPGSYDPELDLLYWGVGNPGPDWNGDYRKGDNLYTCSVVALSPSTGKMKWYFQFTPHDLHDWDANQTSILIDGKFEGEKRKMLVTANRNAFYYLLDRETGEYLRAVPYAKQTWAKGIDKNGRPEVLPDTEPTEEGTLVFPSLQGATNWFSPSYSRQTEYFYVATREMGSYYFKSKVEYEPGEFFLGGGEQALQGDEAKGHIKALEATTGEIKWSFDLHSPPWAGVMSTAGGLVFAGTNEGNFIALDAFTGEALWDFQTGGAIRANPISYGIGNRQYIAIAAGNAIYVFTTEN
ncbi:MAG: PQQ-dependent dehydrogenase, methanol/ethanol family [Cyclobacteriaceae bacterium]|nr:PQQ-dependent dehydrogenase, methanol/ethanol family [Cyclobacteriaceae bacterium]MDH5249930.1 PQQ-dependent dehydrogenase, methanol/ethanol family [Cyclobacteriaceae bacterium]